jgi:hypothetical protein
MGHSNTGTQENALGKPHFCLVNANVCGYSVAAYRLNVYLIYGRRVDEFNPRLGQIFQQLNAQEVIIFNF